MSEVAATKRKIYRSTRVRLNNLQIGAPVRRCEEPPPGPTGRCRRPRLYDTRRLDVWGRRVAGHLTSGDRRNVWTTAQPPDQRRRVLLLVIVIGDLDKPTTLRRLAALRQQRLRKGRIRHQWPFPRHSVLGGRGETVLLFLAAGVLRTPSSIVLWWVHPRGIFYTRCQRLIHCAPVNVSNLQKNQRQVIN